MVYTVGIIQNLFWTNGSRLKPNVLPLLKEPTELNLKIDWTGDKSGSVRFDTKGKNYNYMKDSKGNYFFLTKVRPKDVGKTIFVFSVIKDMWVSNLFNIQNFQGNISNTNITQILRDNLQHVQRVIEPMEKYIYNSQKLTYAGFSHKTEVKIPIYEWYRDIPDWCRQKVIFDKAWWIFVDGIFREINFGQWLQNHGRGWKRYSPYNSNFVTIPLFDNKYLDQYTSVSSMKMVECLSWEGKVLLQILQTLKDPKNLVLKDSTKIYSKGYRIVKPNQKTYIIHHKNDVSMLSDTEVRGQYFPEIDITKITGIKRLNLDGSDYVWEKRAADKFFTEQEILNNIPIYLGENNVLEAIKTNIKISKQVSGNKGLRLKPDRDNQPYELQSKTTHQKVENQHWFQSKTPIGPTWESAPYVTKPTTASFKAPTVPKGREVFGEAFNVARDSVVFDPTYYKFTMFGNTWEGGAETLVLHPEIWPELQLLAVEAGGIKTSGPWKQYARGKRFSTGVIPFVFNYKKDLHKRKIKIPDSALQNYDVFKQNSEGEHILNDLGQKSPEYMWTEGKLRPYDNFQSVTSVTSCLAVFRSLDIKTMGGNASWTSNVQDQVYYRSYLENVMLDAWEDYYNWSLGGNGSIAGNPVGSEAWSSIAGAFCWSWSNWNAENGSSQAGEYTYYLPKYYATHSLPLKDVFAMELYAETQNLNKNVNKIDGKPRKVDVFEFDQSPPTGGGLFELLGTDLYAVWSPDQGTHRNQNLSTAGIWQKGHWEFIIKPDANEQIKDIAEDTSLRQFEAPTVPVPQTLYRMINQKNLLVINSFPIELRMKWKHSSEPIIFERFELYPLNSKTEGIETTDQSYLVIIKTPFDYIERSVNIPKRIVGMRQTDAIRLKAISLERDKMDIQMLLENKKKAFDQKQSLQNASHQNLSGKLKIAAGAALAVIGVASMFLTAGISAPIVTSALGAVGGGLSGALDWAQSSKKYNDIFESVALKNLEFEQTWMLKKKDFQLKIDEAFSQVSVTPINDAWLSERRDSLLGQTLIHLETFVPSHEQMQYVTDYIKEFGCDVFVRDYQFDLNHLNEGDLIQFSELNTIPIEDDVEREYLSGVFLNGVKISNKFQL